MELLQKSTIYLRDYFYTTLSGTDISYRALSYKELENIQSKYQHKYNQSRITTIKTALESQEDFSILSSKDIVILHSTILEVSSVSTKDIKTIEYAVKVVLDDTFKDDTFKSCKLCQKKKLDRHRNCPLLDSATHDPGVFYILDSEKITVCPMDGVNSPIVGDAFRAHGMYDNGFLPSSGGLYEQSMFFVEVSSLVKGLISNYQSKMIEKK